VKFYEFGEGCCSSTYVSRRIKLTNVCVADEHSSTGWLWREPAAFAVAAGGEPRSAARASTSRQQGRGSSMPPAEITYVHAHTLHIIFEKINYASYVRRRTCLLFFFEQLLAFALLLIVHIRVHIQLIELVSSVQCGEVLTMIQQVGNFSSLVKSGNQTVQ
jgi:hypothetical protein